MFLLRISLTVYVRENGRRDFSFLFLGLIVEKHVSLHRFKRQQENEDNRKQHYRKEEP
jgi:hypothetical protein